MFIQSTYNYSNKNQNIFLIKKTKLWTDWLSSSDHMDASNTILASGLVADAASQFIFPGSRDSK